MSTESHKPDAVYLPDGRPAGGPKDMLREIVLAVPNLAKLLGRLARDPRVPTGAKRLAGFVAAYLVSPIDVFPDFIPFIGRTDDAFIAAYAVHYLVRAAGEDVVREHWDGSDRSLYLLLDIVETVNSFIPRPVRLGLRRLGRLALFRTATPP